MQPVKQIRIKKGSSVNNIVNGMQETGVMASGRFGNAVDIFEKMIRDKDCKVFFGLAGAMVPGGMRQIIADMITDGWIDVLVTTGANMTHDLIEAMGNKHYIGTHLIDDSELFDKNIDRIYDIFLENKSYTELEEWLHKIYEKLPDKKIGVREFLAHIGKNVDDKNSILAAAAKKNVPVFCPGIADSAIGFHTWSFLSKPNKKINIDTFEDMKEMMDLTWTSEKAGVFIIGGGVPKDFILQSMQFSPKQHSYAVQITLDRPESGGLSGAELREAVSWGKLGKNAKFTTVICDATIALPFIRAALLERGL